MLVEAQHVDEIARADTLLADLASLRATTMEILADARAAGDHTTALRAIARGERQIELVARIVGLMRGELSVVVHEEQTITVVNDVAEYMSLVEEIVADAVGAARAPEMSMNSGADASPDDDGHDR